MKNWIYITLLLVGTVSCHQNKEKEQSTEREAFQEDENVQNFEIDNALINFSTFINDTIQAKAILETGCRELCIDISFFERYLNTGQKKKLNLLQFGFASSSKELDTTYFVKSSPVKIQIGKHHIVFNDYCLFDFKKKNIKGDLMLPIPFKDSLLIWELNMEKQYIKLHDYSEDMRFDGYNSVDIYSNGYKSNKILFDLPVQYPTSGMIMEKDTLFCLFDTGYPLDILLWNSSKVIKKIGQQKLSNGLTNGGYIKVFRTKASFFNSNIQDTSSIRFEENPRHIPNFDIAGLNFIIRFNYFIDLYNMKLYYQQIENPCHFYSRDGYDIGGGYGHYDDELNLVIDSIGKFYENDALARAGAKDGDIVIWFCGYSVKEQIEKLMDFRDVVFNYGSYHFKVIRNNDTIDLRTNRTF
jgi:hypothetical protein